MKVFAKLLIPLEGTLSSVVEKQRFIAAIHSQPHRQEPRATHETTRISSPKFVLLVRVRSCVARDYVFFSRE